MRMEQQQQKQITLQQIQEQEGLFQLRTRKELFFLLQDKFGVEWKDWQHGLKEALLDTLGMEIGTNKTTSGVFYFLGKGANAIVLLVVPGKKQQPRVLKIGNNAGKAVTEHDALGRIDRAHFLANDIKIPISYGVKELGSGLHLLVQSYLHRTPENSLEKQLEARLTIAEALGTKGYTIRNSAYTQQPSETVGNIYYDAKRHLTSIQSTVETFKQKVVTDASKNYHWLDFNLRKILAVKSLLELIDVLLTVGEDVGGKQFGFYSQCQLIHNDLTADNVISLKEDESSSTGMLDYGDANLEGSIAYDLFSLQSPIFIRATTTNGDIGNPRNDSFVDQEFHPYNKLQKKCKELFAKSIFGQPSENHEAPPVAEIEVIRNIYCALQTVAVYTYCLEKFHIYSEEHFNKDKDRSDNAAIELATGDYECMKKYYLNAMGGHSEDELWHYFHKIMRHIQDITCS